MRTRQCEMRLEFQTFSREENRSTVEFYCEPKTRSKALYALGPVQLH